MRVQLAPDLTDRIKKLDVRIRKSFKKAINTFSKDSNSLELNNHELKRKWEGFKSIDVTAGFRAIYHEIEELDESIAYFVALGTHDELYGKLKNEV